MAGMVLTVSRKHGASPVPNWLGVMAELINNDDGALPFHGSRQSKSGIYFFKKSGT
jgi:hypothetical protein